MITRGNPFKWVLGWRETVNLGLVTDSPRAVFLLPRVNLYSTFAFRATTVTAGDVLVKLRFGFQATTPITGYGCDSIVITTVNQTEIRSVGYAIGAALPNIPGNPNSILPPVVRVFITTNAVTGFNGTFEVRYACLGIE